MNTTHHSGMTTIVKTVSRMTVILISLFGVSLVLHGHNSPGGGFAGGVIIALAGINYTLAFGARGNGENAGRETLLEKLPGLMGGAMLGFLICWFFLGLLSNGAGPSAGVVAPVTMLCDILIAVNVGAGLVLIFLRLASLRCGEGVRR